MSILLFFENQISSWFGVPHPTVDRDSSLLPTSVLTTAVPTLSHDRTLYKQNIDKCLLLGTLQTPFKHQNLFLGKRLTVPDS